MNKKTLAKKFLAFEKYFRKKQITILKEKHGENFKYSQIDDKIVLNQAKEELQKKFKISETEVADIVSFARYHVVDPSLLGLSILLSALFGLIFLRLLSLHQELDVFTIVIFFLYLFIHPLIGKIFSYFVEYLYNKIDKLYLLRGSKLGNWQAEKKIVISAVWPIACPIMLVKALMSLVFFIGLPRSK